MRILITGASSLMGVGLVELLVRRGDRVRTFQRSPASNREWAREAEHLVGDVQDGDAVRRGMRGCDAVVHLAAKVGVVGRRRDYLAVNVGGTENVLAAATANNVARVVHVSSPSVAHSGSAIIGRGADPPLTAHPGAWYAETKAISELRALMTNSSDTGVVVVRPHLVWGPGDTQLVGRVVDRAASGRLVLVGGGRALIDTTYVDNAVSALAAAVDAVEPGARCAGSSYVISNGEPRPIRELVAGICVAAGVESHARSVPLAVSRPIGSLVERIWRATRRTDDPPITRFLADQLGTAHWFDPRPAREDLSWRPQITIDEGLARLAAWYQDQTR